MSKRIYVKAGTIKLPDMYDAKVHATLQMVASPKALLSRLRTNPNGHLLHGRYAVCHENEVTYSNISAEDFNTKSFLNDGTESVTLMFLGRGCSLYDFFEVNINFVTGSIDILGINNVEAVRDLTDWLHVPFRDFTLAKV